MATPDEFAGRAALQQRVLPAYRASFLDLLAKSCLNGLDVFAGCPLAVENIASAERLEVARWRQAENLHFLRPSSSFYLCWQRGLVDWLRQVEPDVLIVEANPRYPATGRAIDWMHARRRPVIGWGLGAPSLSGSLAAWRERRRSRFLHRLDGMIAYSQRGADEYRAAGIPAERVFVSHNAVTPPPEHLLPERPPGFDGRPAVLFVGRLQARKRIDHLLQACAALPEALQPRLWVVGDGPARSPLEAQAAEVYPSAVFTGALHGPELEAYFRRADLFVLPGTGGLAAQQAMSYGLPVIVAKGDGTQDDLARTSQDPRPANGWRIPPGDLSALKATLLEALQSPERLRRYGAESYRIVKQEINLQAMAAAFVQAMNVITSLGKRPA